MPHRSERARRTGARLGRGVVCAVALASFVLVAGAASPRANSTAQQRPPQSQRRPTIPPEHLQELKRLLAAYVAGDDSVAAQVLRLGASGRMSNPNRIMVVGPIDLEGLRGLRGTMGSTELAALEQVLTDASEPWSRVRASFPLAIAFAASSAAADRGAISGLLRLGQRVLASRPTPVGADAVDDRFEILWHQTAIAMLQGVRVTLTSEYMTAVDARFPPAISNGKPHQTRFPLTRAMLADAQCCVEVVEGMTRRLTYDASGRVVGYEMESRNPTATVPTLAQALALYELAAEQPALRADALVRGAFMLYRMEQREKAHEWLQRVPDITDDPTLRFARHLIGGRVADALLKTDESVRDYQVAYDISPNSQFAGIGLAAALLRSGRAEEGVSVAAAVRAAPIDPKDPWGDFHRLDARFAPKWMAEIRTMIR